MSGSEKRRLQALFDEFNKTGSALALSGGGREPGDRGLVDSYLVTRVKDNLFWLMFKMVGYHDDLHHAHTIKVISWTREDSRDLDLVDDADNRRVFREIDADLLDRHTGTAENWS